MSKGTQNSSRKWEQPWDTYLEAGGNGGIFIVGCLWIPNQVIPAGEHLEAEGEVSTLPLTCTALGIAGHPVGCIPLLLAQGNLGLSWAGAQVVDMQWGERAKMIQIELIIPRVPSPQIQSPQQAHMVSSGQWTTEPCFLPRHLTFCG